MLGGGGGWGMGCAARLPVHTLRGPQDRLRFPSARTGRLRGDDCWGAGVGTAPPLRLCPGFPLSRERRWGGTTVGVWCGRGSRCRGTGGSRTAPTSRVGVGGMQRWLVVEMPRLAAPLDSCLRRNDALGGAAARRGLGDGGPAPGYRPPPVWSAWGCGGAPGVGGWGGVGAPRIAAPALGSRFRGNDGGWERRGWRGWFA